MKFSVIIPIYKAETYLEKAVRSVLNQTYSDYEIILIDDGSPDKCPLMCDRYSAVNPKIRTIHQQNAGVSIARNNGIKAAKGEVICFLDADDEWKNTYLESIKALYEKYSQIIASFTARYIRYPDGEIKLMRIPINENFFIFDRLLGNLEYCRTSCFTIRKDAFKQISLFREHIKRGEDLDLMLRTFCLGAIGYCNIPLIIYNADTPFNSAGASAHFSFPYEEWYKYNYPYRKDLIIHTSSLLLNKICRLLKEHLYKEAFSIFFRGKWLHFLWYKLYR